MKVDSNQFLKLAMELSNLLKDN
uniref:Uncharacterized protein n=1 Tax=Megaselia scalaris TaxID=36166 RepID=T1H2M9_MEGSC